VLTNPRIAVHHGIWKELLTVISRNFTDTHDEQGEKWFFPFAVNETSRIEWTCGKSMSTLTFPPPLGSSMKRFWNSMLSNLA